MARAGDTIDKYFEFTSTTGTPVLQMRLFDGVAATALIATAAFTQLDAGPPTELWVARFTIPEGTAPGSYVLTGTVVEESVERRLLDFIEVRTEDLRSEVDDVSAPGRETEYGTYVKRRLDRLIVLGLRTLDAQVQRQFVELEQIRVLVTVPAITAGDTPTFSFVIFDPTTNILTDLTGATVTFKGQDAANPSIIAWNRDATILDAEQGKADVTLTATDTATPALYNGIVEVFFPGNQKLTAPSFAVNILPAVP